MNQIEDPFGRKFPYIRLSVTDTCNFRCQYCLPNGYKKTHAQEFLSVAEISRLVRAFAGLGVEKIRLTGGEPTLRSDLAEIASEISKIEGIKKIALTTNGFNLKRTARIFFDSGIRALNISVDSLDPKKFALITGHDYLPSILAGIAEAEEVGFETIKINAVLLKDLNDYDLPEFINWIKEKPYSVRFIELMQTLENMDYFKKHHLSASVIKERLLELGFLQEERAFASGPSIQFKHPDYKGSIGLIAPYSNDFCKTCNRLRITARGSIRLCLFGEDDHSIRHLLQEDSQLEELQDTIKNLLHFKREQHYLKDGNSGITTNLSTVGG